MQDGKDVSSELWTLCHERILILSECNLGGSGQDVTIVLQSSGGAADAERAAVEDVGVDHCCSDDAVVEQFLNRAAAMTVFQEMGAPAPLTRSILSRSGAQRL